MLSLRIDLTMMFDMFKLQLDGPCQTCDLSKHLNMINKYIHGYVVYRHFVKIITFCVLVKYRCYTVSS